MTAAEEHTTSQEPQYSSQPDRLRAYTAADDNCAGRGHLAPNSSVAAQGGRRTVTEKLIAQASRMYVQEWKRSRIRQGARLRIRTFSDNQKEGTRKAVRAPLGGGWRGAHGRRRLEMLKGRIVCGGTHSGG